MVTFDRGGQIMSDSVGSLMRQFAAQAATSAQVATMQAAQLDKILEDAAEQTIAMQNLIKKIQINHAELSGLISNAAVLQRAAVVSAEQLCRIEQIMKNNSAAIERFEVIIAKLQQIQTIAAELK